MNIELISWRNPDSEVTIKVTDWITKKPVKNQFIEHPRSFWLLWNYLKKVGFRALFRKLYSRFSEIKRNKKISGLGLGIILESPSDTDISKDDIVLFFAPNHSESSEVITLHYSFVIKFSDYSRTLIKLKDGTRHFEIPEILLETVGWSPFSGVELDVDRIKAALLDFRKELSLDSISIEDSYSESVTYTDHINRDKSDTSKPTAVLFGLGNYAKTAIIPNIKSDLHLKRVHEVDPEQFSYFGSNPNVSFDTSPYPRESLKFDAWFIAGYHHTHCELAISALKQSAYAVIEKPLATTFSQFETFKSVAENRPDSQYFLCFHKRYSTFNNYVRKDLIHTAGQPVDMHCVVYEIPLPDLHWYNWPNSGSRIISNGCHWIDYFMFLNDYSPATEFKVWQPKGSDVILGVKLENNAYLNMSLTDIGSQRLGVRDHIELRSDGVTVKIVDAAYYEAENRDKVLRRAKVNPLDSYKLMYTNIAKKISAGKTGDSIESLRSSELTLQIEKELASFVE